jgi:hypothetical protein
MKVGGLAPSNLIQPTVSLEMPVPSQGHYGFPSFPVVDWFCLFNENAEHYLLHCNRFTVNHIIMLFEINQLNLIGIPVNIDLLSFGNKGNNKITELRTIFQRESQNS